MNYYNENHTDELKHYGVIGMKWGVRRAAKSYSSATTAEGRKKAADKLQKHMDKASKKLNKLDQKATKKLNKAIKKRYGVGGNVEKYTKAKEKADKVAFKGDKFYKAMDKSFKKQSVVSISDHDVAVGKQFADYFKQEASFREGPMYR